MRDPLYRRRFLEIAGVPGLSYDPDGKRVVYERPGTDPVVCANPRKGRFPGFQAPLAATGKFTYRLVKIDRLVDDGSGGRKDRREEVHVALHAIADLEIGDVARVRFTRWCAALQGRNPAHIPGRSVSSPTSSHERGLSLEHVRELLLPRVRPENWAGELEALARGGIALASTARGVVGSGMARLPWNGSPPPALCCVNGRDATSVGLYKGRTRCSTGRR